MSIINLYMQISSIKRDEFFHTTPPLPLMTFPIPLSPMYCLVVYNILIRIHYEEINVRRNAFPRGLLGSSDVVNGDLEDSKMMMVVKDL